MSRRRYTSDVYKRQIQEGKVEFRARTAAENREIALGEVIKLVKEELQK